MSDRSRVGRLRWGERSSWGRRTKESHRIGR